MAALDRDEVISGDRRDIPDPARPQLRALSEPACIPVSEPAYGAAGEAALSSAPRAHPARVSWAAATLPRSVGSCHVMCRLFVPVRRSLIRPSGTHSRRGFTVMS